MADDLKNAGYIILEIVHTSKSETQNILTIFDTKKDVLRVLDDLVNEKIKSLSRPKHDVFRQNIGEHEVSILSQSIGKIYNGPVKKICTYRIQEIPRYVSISSDKTESVSGEAENVVIDEKVNKTPSELQLPPLDKNKKNDREPIDDDLASPERNLPDDDLASEESTLSKTDHPREADCFRTKETSVRAPPLETKEMRETTPREAKRSSREDPSEETIIDIPFYYNIEDASRRIENDLAMCYSKSSSYIMKSLNEMCSKCCIPLLHFPRGKYGLCLNCYNEANELSDI